MAFKLREAFIIIGNGVWSGTGPELISWFRSGLQGWFGSGPPDTKELEFRKAL